MSIGGGWDAGITGTSNNFGLCGQCNSWHVLGYGCPSTTVPPPVIRVGWSCSNGHWYEAISESREWFLYCRKCADFRRLEFSAARPAPAGA